MFIPKLSAHAMKKIKNFLSDMLALIFDGWTLNATYYVAVLASFPADKERWCGISFLSFITFENEIDHSALEHQRYMNRTMHMYGKSWENVVAIVGDNCSVKEKLARDIGRPLVGCALHRLLQHSGPGLPCQIQEDARPC